MTKEIERKWLLENRPPRNHLESGIHNYIRQGYIAIDPKGGEVRVRQVGKRDLTPNYTLTAKTAGGLVRGEVELTISAEDFEEFWRMTEGRQLTKDRYDIKLGGGLHLEVDQYHGPLFGLFTAEVEFTSTETAEDFELPDWLQPAVDVTNRPEFKNAALATAKSIPSLPE